MASLRRSVTSGGSSAAPRRRNVTIPSDAGVTNSSRESASIQACAASVWSMARSIAARNASTPNVSIASQTLIARLARVSCSPRSAKFTPASVPLLEVVGMKLERLLEQAPFAHEQAAHLERHREPLVRIERDRVAPFDPRHRAFAALRQDRECPVGAVDVEPHAALVACVGEVADRIDGAGIRRARICADEERQPIRGEVGVDRRDDVLSDAAGRNRRSAGRAAGRAGTPGGVRLGRPTSASDRRYTSRSAATLGRSAPPGRRRSP